MIKVFLVEDEIIMRESLKNNIAWKQEGFDYVGDACDGELAYPMIQKLQPDILITDIKMPFMDGLELSRLVKKALPDTKIIILSGYDDFEYAKQGISIGVTEYMVKPISSVKLLEAVKTVGKIVQEERLQKSYFEQFQKEQLQHAIYSRQKIYFNLVSGKYSTSVMLEKGQELGMKLSANNYNIIMLQIFLRQNTREILQQVEEITQKIKELAEELQIIVIELELENWSFILKASDNLVLDQIQNTLLDKLIQMITCYKDLEYYIAVGEPVNRLSVLKRSYESAKSAFARRYLEQHNQVVFGTEELSSNINLSFLNGITLNRQEMKKNLKVITRSQLPILLDEYFSGLGPTSIYSMVVCQYAVMDIYSAAVDVLKDLGRDSIELTEYYSSFQNAITDNTLPSYVKALLLRMIEVTIDLRDNAVRQKNCDIIENAKKYILENFSNSEISLGSTASYVMLSSNHFSNIFSKNTGKTFIEFLTYVRMEKAKELLRSSSLRSSEISYAVGYNDSHYFSYLFKKTQGCTPSEFRGKK